jgi:hypothetical protein
MNNIIQSSIQELPDGVTGILLLNIKMFDNDCDACNFIITIDGNVVRPYIIEQLGEKGEEVIELPTHILAPYERGAVFNGEIVKMSKWLKDFWKGFRQSFFVQGYTLDACECLSIEAIELDTKLPFHPSAYFGIGEVFMPSFTFHDGGRAYYPDRFTDIIASKQVDNTPPRQYIPRLSKEDWLRQNYPELSELPTWRFPAHACS